MEAVLIFSHTLSAGGISTERRVQWCCREVPHYRLPLSLWVRRRPHQGKPGDVYILFHVLGILVRKNHWLITSTQGSLNLHSESQLLAALLQEPALSRSSPRAKLLESPSTQVMLQDSPTMKPILTDSPSATAPEQESPSTRTALQESPSTPATPKESALGRITVQDSSSPRTLLIFHCEFSSERGPRL